MGTSLSPLQRDVLYLLARGRTIGQIADVVRQPLEEVDDAIDALQEHFGVVDRRHLIVRAILTHRR